MTPIDLMPCDTPLPPMKRLARMTDPGFGRVFSEHMVTIRWHEGRGWHDARLTPYAPIEIDPANMTLHYGQSIFEGLKAYRQPDHSVAIFRPSANAARFQKSARRMAMPELPASLFVEAVEVLVRHDHEWVPHVPGQSLYLRPFMFATEACLGLRPAAEFLFVVIASPVATYLSGGPKPASVWLSQEYVRAAPGGTGEAKCSGNYAGSLVAQAQAVERGCDQVVWLDARERRWIEEMGGMNLYFVNGRDRVVSTPMLTGSLLPGITRDSILQLAVDHGYSAEEKMISVHDWRQGNTDGSITEVFACGTAAVITPIGSVKSAEDSWTVGGGRPGPVTLEMRKALVDIQTGVALDTHSWMHPVTKSAEQ